MIEEPHVELALSMVEKNAHAMRVWLLNNIGKFNQTWNVTISENSNKIILCFRSNEDKVQFVLAWGQECLMLK